MANEKCPACGSCGFPMETLEDHALGDTSRPYCRYCTDARGELLPYEKVLETNASYYEESQGVKPDVAMRLAQAMLADMPAWRDRQ